MSSEKILSIFAIAISIFALLVAVWQGMDNREFNKLSVRPHLQINPKLTGGKESGLYLENAGTGTAFIHSITLSVNGKEFDLIENSSTDFFNYINVEPGCYKESWPRKGAAVQSGKEFPLIQVTEANVSLCNFEAIKFLTEPGVRMNISYISPYNEEFEFSEIISLSERELGVYFELIGKLRNITKPLNSLP